MVARLRTQSAQLAQLLKQKTATPGKPGFEAKPLETIDTAERDEHGLLVLQREVMKRAAALGRYSVTRLTPTHLCAYRAR
jgi:hypothetical protein